MHHVYSCHEIELCDGPAQLLVALLAPQLLVAAALAALSRRQRLGRGRGGPSTIAAPTHSRRCCMAPQAADVAAALVLVGGAAISASEVALGKPGYLHAQIWLLPGVMHACSDQWHRIQTAAPALCAVVLVYAGRLLLGCLQPPAPNSISFYCPVEVSQTAVPNDQRTN
jgi:hypothetical protein